MAVRPATHDDLPAVVDLTRSYRARLAQWAPVYFRPAPSVDDLHAAYLEWLIASPEHDTRVVAGGARVLAFAHVIDQGRHRWVDDLCWVDGRADAGVTLVATIASPPVVTCVATGDRDRRARLEAAGLVPASEYWSRILDPPAAHGPPSSAATLSPDSSVTPPVHTFGAVDPAAPGALVLTTHDSQLVGSPSMTPPTYDPGGPTCVVDHVVGSDRAALLRHGMTAAADRGDAQMVVVVAAHDTDLAHILDDAGFAPQVTVLQAG